MTVSATNAHSTGTGNGVATEFPFTFFAETAAEVAVYLDGALQSSGYTVTQNAGGAGGTVTFSSAPANGVAVLIASQPLFTQSIAFGNAGAFLPSTHDEAFDRGAVRDIYLKERVDRALKLPVGESPADIVDWGNGQFLARDADGNPVGSSGTGADSGLRTDLAANTGAALVAGTSPAGETVPLQRHIVRNYLEDISGFVEGSSGVAADNATALNAALASGGVYYNMRPGALYKIAQILPKSNTALVFEGSNKPTIYMPAANFTRADNTFATRYGTNAVGILAQGLTSGLYTPLTDIILANFILQSEVADNRNITGICGRNVERMLIDGVEVFGLPLGAGINLQSAVDCEIRNPYVHDMITDTTDATLIANAPNVTGILVGSDEVNSIACDNVRIINPTIHDVTTGSNFRTANGADQSDGITLVGQSNGAFVVEGYDIRNTGEGIDCSASHSRFSDGYISDTSIFGMKFIHGAKLNTVNGLVIIRAGLAGLSFYGTDIAGAGDTANNRASGVTISDIDPNNSWVASDTSAVLFADNVGTAGKPKNNLVDSPIINIGANGNYGVLDTSTGSGNSAPNPTITTGAATAKRVHAPNNACTFPQSRYGAVKVIGSGDQAITTSTLTALQWTGEAFDPHGQHDNSTNPERLNATVRGIYEITGLVRFNANATGARYAQLYLSGAAVAGTYVTNDASASREVTLPIQATVLLEANDYIEVRVYQDSGGNLNLDRGSSFLSMKLVREA